MCTKGEMKGRIEREEASWEGEKKRKSEKANQKKGGKPQLLNHMELSDSIPIMFEEVPTCDEKNNKQTTRDRIKPMKDKALAMVGRERRVHLTISVCVHTNKNEI